MHGGSAQSRQAARRREAVRAGPDQRLDRIELHHLFGEGRRYDPPPATPRIFDDIPIQGLFLLFGLGLCHEAANRLGWISEGRVAFFDESLGHLRLAQDEPYLRAVAVPDRDVPTRLDPVRNVQRRLFGGFILIGCRWLLLRP